MYKHHIQVLIEPLSADLPIQQGYDYRKQCLHVAPGTGNTIYLKQATND